MQTRIYPTLAVTALAAAFCHSLWNPQTSKRTNLSSFEAADGALEGAHSSLVVESSKILAVLTLGISGDIFRYPQTLDKLDVTDGKIETAAGGHLQVRSKEMRAVLKTPMPARAKVELKFTYLGPSEEVSRLGNGDVRHQFGLKLFAQDPCNLLYVMWDLDHPSGLRVSVKKNPGLSTSSQCRDGGYVNLKPAMTKSLPVVTVSSSHVLTVETQGADFTAYVDGQAVWEGRNDVLPDLKGPAGLRSDNIQALFNLDVY